MEKEIVHTGMNDHQFNQLIIELRRMNELLAGQLKVSVAR